MVMVMVMVCWWHYHHVRSGSHGAIVVYDITSSTSFERAKMWINELREHLGRKARLAAPSSEARTMELSS
jgi:hypothetical protein